MTVLQKKQPMRMCTGCGEMKPKRELIRIVKSKDGEISLDKTGKKSGRGAYLCYSAECLKKAAKTGRISRSFGMPIPDEVYERLNEEMNADD